MPRRLIEEAFPLEKVSEDSKYEKNALSGHIASLHTWPARRPLAACRAVAIATLLPDPADAPEKMKAEYKRLAGSALPEKQREYLCNDLIASLTRWGDENGHGDWNRKDKSGRWLNKLRIVRELIEMAYGDRPPKVLDMFAGGGAIPLEAMRLGCEVTANDYNPVAWFILKCTLEYPQRLAGHTHKLPELGLAENLNLGDGDLVDHVRLWGHWVLKKAREELLHYYPAVNGKPTVAYLWARTIPCQDQRCGATIPLLKTVWLGKKAERTLKDTPENRNRPDFLRLKEQGKQTKVVINAKRALKLYPDKKTKRVRFEVVVPGDKVEVGEPTMSGSSATCPFCGGQQPSDYIKRCGHERTLGTQMTAVLYKADYGKAYRPPTAADMRAAEVPTEALKAVTNEIPHGVPNEPLPDKGRHRAVGSQLPDYGFETWADLFTDRQLLALMTFVKWVHAAQQEMGKSGYPPEWLEAINGYLACVFDRVSDHASNLVLWMSNAESIGHVFVSYTFPMTWDFSEGAILGEGRGSYQKCLERILDCVEPLLRAHGRGTPACAILHGSATNPIDQEVDAVITDPPYYDAIPYADLSDFFYVWLRRLIGAQFTNSFLDSLTPKSEELIQQHKTGERGRIGKEFYENGMAESFRVSYRSLDDDGRVVIVFAHKSVDAWETLVKAMIESGLVVTASWPIDTESKKRLRGQGSAALATSLWLVCRKRPANVRVGHYGKVRRDMQTRITERLRYFWDAGIRGPDFVWAAIGPALESYSAYKEVKRNDGQPFSVTEFLTEVRRVVTDFALGRILDGTSTEALDEWTRYYLMHKDYFGSGDAPVGECIQLAQGYGVSLDDLRAKNGGILRKGRSGNTLKLLGHTERTSDRIGEVHTSGRIPMIDMIHKVMKLWNENQQNALNGYFHAHGLQENPLFKAVVQALIEMDSNGSSERSLLEALIGYEPSEPVGGSYGSGTSERAVKGPEQPELPFDKDSS